MKFSKVIGQSQLKEQLIGMVKSGRISHTMLFAGPQGSGKLPIAMAYAQYLLCQNPTDTDSCGTCPSCRRVAKLEHPDLHMIYPVIKRKSTDDAKSEDFITSFREMYIKHPYFSYNNWIQKLNAENKQAGIFVSENKTLMHKLSMKSYGDNYKVFVIWMMEKVNQVTANKLLKALEEPPEKTIFLLVTDRIELILPTIISRSQLARTAMLKLEEIKEGLISKFGVPDAQAEKLAVFADGNFHKAVSLMDNTEELDQNLERFANYFRHCYSFNVEGINSMANEFKTFSRDNLIDFLEYSLFLIRNNMALNLHLEQMVRMTDEERKFSENFHKLINPATAHLVSREIEEAIFHIGRNVNTRIVMFDLAIKIYENLRTKA
jgi:DNA polymerase-3 subunit delta'